MEIEDQQNNMNEQNGEVNSSKEDFQSKEYLREQRNELQTKLTCIRAHAKEYVDGWDENHNMINELEMVKALINKLDNPIVKEVSEQRKERKELLDDTFKKEMSDLRERSENLVPPFAKRSLGPKFGGHQKEITQKENRIYEKLCNIECEIAEIIEMIEEDEQK